MDRGREEVEREEVYREKIKKPYMFISSTSHTHQPTMKSCQSYDWYKPDHANTY